MCPRRRREVRPEYLDEGDVAQACEELMAQSCREERRFGVDCALGRLWKRIADTPEMLSQWGMCAGREGERLQSDGS